MGITRFPAEPATRSDSGFTLVELMLALVISGLLIMSVYSVYQAQRETYETQDQITEMQQNTRAVFWYMIKEIRMAGYDPTEKAKAKLIHGGPTEPTYYSRKNRISFFQDLNEDGDTDDSQEKVAYGFSNTDDPDADGKIAGSGVAPLGRNIGGGFQPIAENISAVEFRYVLEDGTKIPVDPAPTNHQLEETRAIEISLLARARYPDPKFTNNMTYHSASGAAWGPYNDNYRRLLLTATVECRNLGLH